MNKKITTFLCIVLILFSGTSNLFAAGPHECEMEMKQSESRCPMTMEKMDCCPVEQQDSSCACPEMNSNNEPPAETSAVILSAGLNNPGKYISIQYDLINLEIENQKDYSSQVVVFKPITNTKIYKSLQTFLI